MPTNCEVILQWGATPEQLTALGAALWRWCNRAAANATIYQRLDNQALADLVAGKLPDSSLSRWQADRRGVHFWVPGENKGKRDRPIPTVGTSAPVALPEVT